MINISCCNIFCRLNLICLWAYKPFGQQGSQGYWCYMYIDWFPPALLGDDDTDMLTFYLLFPSCFQATTTKCLWTEILRNVFNKFENSFGSGEVGGEGGMLRWALLVLQSDLLSFNGIMRQRTGFCMDVFEMDLLMMSGRTVQLTLASSVHMCQNNMAESLFVCSRTHYINHSVFFTITLADFII